MVEEGRITKGRLTAGYRAVNGIITRQGTALILWKFIGQEVKNLREWADEAKYCVSK